MEPRIEVLAEKKLIGTHLLMSLADNKTVALWSGFMPRRKEILNPASKDLFSIQIFHHLLRPEALTMDTVFEKWAAVEVSEFSVVPEGMETLVLPKGLYAVFLHKGPASEGARTFQYIFGTWIPHSAYDLDDRPHFEILGAKYKNNQPESEEEVWIPVKFKSAK